MDCKRWCNAVIAASKLPHAHRALKEHRTLLCQSLLQSCFQQCLCVLNCDGESTCQVCEQQSRETQLHHSSMQALCHSVWLYIVAS